MSRSASTIAALLDRGLVGHLLVFFSSHSQSFGEVCLFDCGVDEVHGCDSIFVQRESGTNVGVLGYAFINVYIQVGLVHEADCETEASNASACNRNANLLL